MELSLLQQFITLFVVIDPVGMVPVFIALTGRFDDRQRSRIALKSVLVAGIVLIGFIVLGQVLLNYLGIGMNSFKIAGGIILFLVSLKMVMFEPHPDSGNLTRREDVAIFPLAMPMLAGPASMMAVMVLSDSSRHSIIEQAATGLLVITILAVTWVILMLAGPILKIIRNDGADVLSRIMGLILAALSVETIVAGIKGLIAAG